MCGIAGAVTNVPIDDARVDATLAALRQRGPDARGHIRQTVGDHHVTLIHTRLAIIDLDRRADQPFRLGNQVMIFNGEIYNYVELRGELEGLGDRFETASDTEVLATAWNRWGEAALDRLEGMWALAVLDLDSGDVVLSRDRFGEKPLFLWRRPEGLYFASEIKSLAALAGERPAPNLDQVRRYLARGYKFLMKGRETFHAGVEALPAAHSATIRDGMLQSPQAYWRLRHQPHAMSEADALAGTRERLHRALEIRLRADVPLAFCLSGGVDSTTLAAIATRSLGQDVHAYSIVDRDPRYDERANMDAVVKALDIRQHVVEVRRDGFLDRLRDLVAYHDMPVATISYYVHAALSEAIAADGFKVAVMGTGADELFTGYYDHYGMWLKSMHDLPPADRPKPYEAMLDDWHTGLGRVVRNPHLQDPEIFLRDPDHRAHLMENTDIFEGSLAAPFDAPFTEAEFTTELLRNRMLNELFHEVVPVLLAEDDLNSMRVSVENRSPFLDRSLAEFLYSVPSALLIKDGFQKWLLRAAGEGLVPDSVRLDKTKRGFNASIESLLDVSDPATREHLLAPSPIFDVVRRDSVETFLTGNLNDNSFSKFLFSFASAKMFLEAEAA